MDIRPGLCPYLLCQQINDIKLLEGCERCDQDRWCYDRLYHGYGNIPCLLQPGRPVKDSTFIKALIKALQGTVYDRDHKGQRQPEIHYGTADKCKYIAAKPPYRLPSQLLESLVQQTEL